MAEEEVGFHESVWAVVGNIPRGRVASYKRVGELAGYPRSARFVGRAMAFAPGSALPWHRVIGADGRVLIRDPGLRKEQITRLLAEGVVVDERGVVPLARFEWRGD